MSLQSGLQNIWSSDYVQKNPNKAYKASYGAEYTAVAAYLNGGPEPNFAGYSKMGKGLCEIEKERRGAVVVPPEPPDPPLSAPVVLDNTTGKTVDGGTLTGPGTLGIGARNVTGLTIKNVNVSGFRSTANYSGAGINIVGATDSEIADSVIKNCGNSQAAFCNGALGLGDLLRCKVHGLTVDTDIGYAVKATRDGATLRDSDIYNNTFTVRSTQCSSWNTLCVELYNTDALNTHFRNNDLNGVLSLTDTGSSTALPEGQYRYMIHNNRWTITSGNFYAIELDQHSCEIHHNYFKGGLYPFFNAAQAKSGNVIVHNVFDDIVGPVGLCNFEQGVTNTKFIANTVVLRRGFPQYGLFRNVGNMEIRDNIFISPAPLGDQLGNIPQAIIDNNLFCNVTARGSNAFTADPGMSLTGGFPAAYQPSAAYTGYGAFSGGAFAVGPQ